MENQNDSTEQAALALAQLQALRMAKLTAWNEALKATEAAKLVVAAEQALRKEVAALFFPTPREGTNNYPLANDWVLKYAYPLKRDVDIGALNALKEKFREALISEDKMVEYKPVLVKAEYDTLTAEQKQLFDQCLIIKPGSITLEIVLPKKKPKNMVTAESMAAMAQINQQVNT